MTPKPANDLFSHPENQQPQGTPGARNDEQPMYSDLFREPVYPSESKS
jgi:hypothetical protein